MLSRVLRTIDEHGLLDEGDRVLVGVSGGPDSTALLHALVHLAPTRGITVEAACVDHGLRNESAAEAAAVAARAAALGVSCQVIRVDVHGARGRHVSWQEAARVRRLEALAAHAKAEGCDCVALGHTEDDQAETVLFRVIRGTGLAGLAGIPYRRDLFVRPLLDVSRRSVLAFLRRRGLAFVDDPSNADRRYARARLRHDVLPALARENPRIREALVRLAAEALRGGPVGQPLAGWQLLPRAADTVARLARPAAGTKRVSIQGGRVVEIRYGRVALAEPPLATAAEGFVDVPGPGRYPWLRVPGAFVSVDEQPAPQASANPMAAVSAVFDAAGITWPLRVRTVHAGDRMRPRGGPGRRKLQDLLVDAKIPRSWRALLPVVVDAEGHILFVPGVRPSERGRPTSETRRLVRIDAILPDTWLRDLCPDVR